MNFTRILQISHLRSGEGTVAGNVVEVGMQFFLQLQVQCYCCSLGLLVITFIHAPQLVMFTELHRKSCYWFKSALRSTLHICCVRCGHPFALNTTIQNSERGNSCLNIDAKRNWIININCLVALWLLRLQHQWWFSTISPGVTGKARTQWQSFAWFCLSSSSKLASIQCVDKPIWLNCQWRALSDTFLASLRTLYILHFRQRSNGSRVPLHFYSVSSLTILPPPLQFLSNYWVFCFAWLSLPASKCSKLIS